MTKNTFSGADCYVSPMLAQGQHKWPGFFALPFRVHLYERGNAELEDINYDVYWRLVEMRELDLTVLTLDDWHGLFYAKRLARGLEY